MVQQVVLLSARDCFDLDLLDDLSLATEVDVRMLLQLTDELTATYDLVMSLGLKELMAIESLSYVERLDLPYGLSSWVLS